MCNIWLLLIVRWRGQKLMSRNEKHVKRIDIWPFRAKQYYDLLAFCLWYWQHIKPSKVETCYTNQVKKNLSNPLVPTTCHQIKFFVAKQSITSIIFIAPLLSLNVDKQLEQRRLWAEELAIVDGQIQGLQMELRQQARWVGVNNLQGSVTDHIKGDQVVKGWWP